MFGGVFGLEGTQRQIEEDSGIFWHNAMSSLGSRKTEQKWGELSKPNLTQLNSKQLKSNFVEVRHKLTKFTNLLYLL